MLTRWARSLIALGVVACSNSGEDPAASTVRPMDGTDTPSGDAPESDAPNCSDGDTRVCVGSGACEGGQRCEDGEWGECDCGEGAQGGNSAVGGQMSVSAGGSGSTDAPVGVGSGGDTSTTPGATTPSISNGGAAPNPTGGGGEASTPSNGEGGRIANGGASGSPSPSPSGTGGGGSDEPWIEVPLVVGDTGRVELGSNSVGIEGEWSQTAYLSCLDPNEPTSIGSDSFEPPVPNESGAYCVYGTWDEYCGEFNALYFGIRDGDPLEPYKGYDATAHGVVGFAFDLTSNVESSDINFGVYANSRTADRESRSLLYLLAAETAGTQRAYILWTEGSLFPPESEVEWSTSTFSGLSFGFGGEANTPFDFCLSNLAALVDPNH